MSGQIPSFRDAARNCLVNSATNSSYASEAERATRTYLEGTRFRILANVAAKVAYIAVTIVRGLGACFSVLGVGIAKIVEGIGQALESCFQGRQVAVIDAKDSDKTVKTTPRIAPGSTPGAPCELAPASSSSASSSPSNRSGRSPSDVDHYSHSNSPSLRFNFAEIELSPSAPRNSGVYEIPEDESRLARSASQVSFIASSPEDVVSLLPSPEPVQRQVRLNPIPPHSAPMNLISADHSEVATPRRTDEHPVSPAAAIPSVSIASSNASSSESASSESSESSAVSSHAPISPEVEDVTSDSDTDSNASSPAPSPAPQLTSASPSEEPRNNASNAREINHLAVVLFNGPNQLASFAAIPGPVVSPVVESPEPAATDSVNTDSQALENFVGTVLSNIPERNESTPPSEEEQPRPSSAPNLSSNKQEETVAASPQAKPSIAAESPVQTPAEVTPPPSAAPTLSQNAASSSVFSMQQGIFGIGQSTQPTFTPSEGSAFHRYTRTQTFITPKPPYGSWASEPHDSTAISSTSQASAAAPTPALTTTNTELPAPSSAVVGSEQTLPTESAPATTLPLSASEATPAPATVIIPSGPAVASTKSPRSGNVSPKKMSAEEAKRKAQEALAEFREKNRLERERREAEQQERLARSLAFNEQSKKPWNTNKTHNIEPVTESAPAESPAVDTSSVTIRAASPAPLSVAAKEPQAPVLAASTQPAGAPKEQHESPARAVSPALSQADMISVNGSQNATEEPQESPTTHLTLMHHSPAPEQQVEPALSQRSAMSIVGDTEASVAVQESVELEDRPSSPQNKEEPTVRLHDGLGEPPVAPSENPSSLSPALSFRRASSPEAFVTEEKSPQLAPALRSEEATSVAGDEPAEAEENASEEHDSDAVSITSSTLLSDEEAE